MKDIQVVPLPEYGYLRLDQIIGNKAKGIPAILPIGRSTFLAGVKEGRYPQPSKLSDRCVAWPVEAIKKLISELQEGA